MLKIRRSRDRLIINMGIPIPRKDDFYIETEPCWFCLLLSSHTDTALCVAIYSHLLWCVSFRCPRWRPKSLRIALPNTNWSATQIKAQNHLIAILSSCHVMKLPTPYMVGAVTPSMEFTVKGAISRPQNGMTRSSIYVEHFWISVHTLVV